MACESGNLAEARDYLRRVEEKFSQGIPNLKAYDVRQWKASVYLLAGNLSDAQRVARQALTEAQADKAEPGVVGAIVSLLARILASDPLEDDKEAYQRFEEALTLLPDAVPTTYSRAMALYHYGRYLTDKGEAERAKAHLSEAGHIFERPGVRITCLDDRDDAKRTAAQGCKKPRCAPTNINN